MGKATGSRVPRLCPCGRNGRNVGIGNDGERRYGVLCKTCHKYNIRNKKNYCELCGFIAQVPQQIEVDHIDGNKKNNAEDNLQCLCANCHRFKTHANKEWRNKYE